MNPLYITDLDGTLLNENAVLSERTVEILRPLVAQGLPLTVATARSPATAVELLRPLGLVLPAALMTGVMMYDLAQPHVLSTAGLSAAAAAAVCDMLETTGQEALAYCVKDDALHVYYKHFSCELERKFVAGRMYSPYKTFVPTKNYFDALVGGQPLMFLLCLPELRMAHTYYTLLSAIPDITCYFYAYEYSDDGYILEVYPSGKNKGAAAQALREMTGADTVVAFGDNINDIPMFAQADISCAVANAASDTIAAATYCIGANTQSSVAQWIAAHWEANRVR